MMLVLQDLLFARLDFPEKGTPNDIRHARECLFPNFLYRIEVVEQTGIERIFTKAKDGRMMPRSQQGAEWNNTKITIALKGVKYWWPAEMFSIFDAGSRPYDLRLMRPQKTSDNCTYYKGSKFK